MALLPRACIMEISSSTNASGFSSRHLYADAFHSGIGPGDTVVVRLGTNTESELRTLFFGEVTGSYPSHDSRHPSSSPDIVPSNDRVRRFLIWDLGVPTTALTARVGSLEASPNANRSRGNSVVVGLAREMGGSAKGSMSSRSPSSKSAKKSPRSSSGSKPATRVPMMTTATQHRIDGISYSTGIWNNRQRQGIA